MSEMPLILIGGGGHCKSCIDVIEASGAWKIIGILDKEYSEKQYLLNYPIIGTDDDIDELIAVGNYFLITVGQIKSAVVRIALFNKLRSKRAKIATVISPKAVVSKYATIGEGTIIHHFCIVNADTHIGENNIINTAANIEHDVQVGSHNHISTCSVLNGHVKLGNACFVGSGTILRNGIDITDNVIIGAGSLVTADIKDAGVYLGSPVKRIIQ